MYANVKWISRLTLTALVILAGWSAASAQSHVFLHTRSWMPADEAREIFNAGQRFYDEYRFSEAENRFREVVRRFPRNPIADRADYYLIRTLAQVGKKTEALNRIDGFAKQYPRSKWQDDVQEMRIQLTNQIPARAEYILLQTAAPAPPAPPVRGPFGPPNPAATPATPVTSVGPVTPFGSVSAFTFSFQSTDPEVSLQQEIMRAMFRNNVNRAIEIAMERLKANPVDPVVLSSLNLIAASQSAQAMPMLLGIVRNSPNPKARRDAIFWLGQSGSDGDVVVETLVSLLPSLAEDDSESVTYALSQVRSNKSAEALTAIARDKSKSEKVRNNAVFWISQSRASNNRVALLEDIYKNSMDSVKIRSQVMFALSQTREPGAAAVIGNAAFTDPDIEVRKKAVFWLGQSKSPEASQALERLLQKK